MHQQKINRALFNLPQRSMVHIYTQAIRHFILKRIEPAVPEEIWCSGIGYRGQPLRNSLLQVIAMRVVYKPKRHIHQA
jgi:hypothetical protein